MTKTTLQNSTKSVVVLREGQAQVFRRVCDIQANGRYAVPSELHQTYKEYMCASSDGKSQFTLSSDDLCEWKEIEITPSDSDPEKFHWQGTIPATGFRSTPVKVTSRTTPPGQVAHPQLLSKVVHKIRGWFPSKPAETRVNITTITIDPATKATTNTTDSATTATSIPITQTVTTTQIVTTPLATITENKKDNGGG